MFRAKLVMGLVLATALVLSVAAWQRAGDRKPGADSEPENHTAARTRLDYLPRQPLDISGFETVKTLLPAWGPDASLETVSEAWKGAATRGIEQIDEQLSDARLDDNARYQLLFTKASLRNYLGDPENAYAALAGLRGEVEASNFWARQMLFSLIYCQGVTALRRGENENCILCRGESSCILPISSAAVHVNPAGSRLAIDHFLDYLGQFPDDLEVRWLLNLAHMTLGEHPDRVDPRFLIRLDRFNAGEYDVGKFRDVGHRVGLNHFNQGGGAIMDDFDRDGLLDVVTGTFDATAPMAFFRNTGTGSFVNATGPAGLTTQWGGIYCVQTDYNNDGFLDFFTVRGAWLQQPVRPSLLLNQGDGTFSDATREAGLLKSVNSLSASWADFDNDGLLDLFICCERQPSRLCRNLGNGVFEDVAIDAGLRVDGRVDCKGSAWIDYDNDGFQDLFLDYLTAEGSELYHNNRNGTFNEVTAPMGMNGPLFGFSCWSWDYDNDGWLDIFATSYDRSLEAIVKGILDEPHQKNSGRLYRNLAGRGFEDKTREAGLDKVYAAMGTNFGDFDNDGFLDMYLGTGDPNLYTLVPNRLFKNVAGGRFAEASGPSGMAHLQKGHGIAFGDWDRDGDNDIFIEMGGAIPGDRYHNILFENPGSGNNSLTVRLIGRETNRPAIGARIKIVTSGDAPLTVCRHISSGSSFGANPLQQTIGLARAERIDILQIDWPSSGTTQVFRNVAVDQAIEITEFDDKYRMLDWQPIVIPTLEK